MPIGAIIGAGASLAGSAKSASAARAGARAQEEAANRDIAFQRETRDQIVQRLDPFYQSGIGAQNALAFEMGLGERPMIGGTAPQIEAFTETMGMGGPAQPMDERERLIQMISSGATTREGQDAAIRARSSGAATVAQPQTRQRFRVGGQVFDTMEDAQAFANANRTGGTAYQGFQATPGFQFEIEQGQDAINALAGARGGVNSGRTLQDLTTFRMGLANREYNNFLNRLSGLAGSGQNAAASQGTAMGNAAVATSNALGNIGDARAAGASGVASAWNQGINNGLSIWQYQQGLQPNQPGGLTTSMRPMPNPRF